MAIVKVYIIKDLRDNSFLTTDDGWVEKITSNVRNFITFEEAEEKIREKNLTFCEIIPTFNDERF